MISLDKIIEAAREYREGLKLRREIAALSSRELAKKFERAEKYVRAIGRGEIPSHIPWEEVRLIRACYTERERLKKIYRGKTRNALAKKYRITGNTLMAEMESIDG